MQLQNNNWWCFYFYFLSFICFSKKWLVASIARVKFQQFELLINNNNNNNNRWNANFSYLLHFTEMARSIRIIGHRTRNIARVTHHPFIQGTINGWWWKRKGPPELQMGWFLITCCIVPASWSEWPCTRRSGSAAGATFNNFVLVHSIIYGCWFVVPGTACERAEWEESSHIPGRGWLAHWYMGRISG